MGYENLNILRSYKTNKNDIVREFYVPILTQSVLYKRAVGFFSSTALIELSKGISGLISNQREKKRDSNIPLDSDEPDEGLLYDELY